MQPTFTSTGLKTMIDLDTAEEGIARLRDAVIELTTVQQDVASRTATDRHWITVTNLMALGQDVSTLAAAMGVLARRSEESRENPYPFGR